MMPKSQRIIRIITILCFVTLLASVAINTVLFTVAIKYYLLLNATRLDPLDLNYYSLDSKQKNIQTPTAVFFGDSRSEEWPTPNGLQD